MPALIASSASVLAKNPVWPLHAGQLAQEPFAQLVQIIDIRWAGLGIEHMAVRAGGMEEIAVGQRLARH